MSTTAVETWPDGTPKRRPGFDPARWAGEQPLVPHPPVPIELGTVVWEKTPEQRHVERETGDVVEDSGDNTIERRGGIVVKIAMDPETGERKVSVLQGRKRQSRFEVFLVELDASDVDGYTLEARSARRMHHAARQILRALGERTSAFIAGHDRHLLELAVGLVVVCEEDAAVLTAAHDQHQAEKWAATNAAEITDWEENRG